MKYYIAIVHKDKNSCYGVSFPDFPGCTSGGDTLEKALRNAAEGLASHVELMLEDGEKIPAPRDISQIKGDEIDWHNARAAIVPLLPANDVAEKISVTMSKKLLARIDSVTSNRSAFLARAAEAQLYQGFDKKKRKRGKAA